jgi:hypothetical protein
MNKPENKDQKYVHLIKNLSYNPIFILGLHRSGTSILYKMLAKTDCFNIVTAYNLIKFNELLHNHVNGKEKDAKKNLEKYFFEIGITKRAIDNLEVKPDFAEEYGFLLSNLDSPCKLDDNNIEVLDDLCKKIMYISGNNKPILLKNPYDFSNFLYIKNKFPNAKFVFIHRNPISVINSSINAWRVLFEKKNPYTSLLSKRYEKNFVNPLQHKFIKFYFSSKGFFGLRSVIKLVNNSTDYYMENIDKLDLNCFISIKYEDLCNDPNMIIRNITDFLECSIDIDFAKYIKPRNLNLFKDVEKKQKMVKNKMNLYYKKLKYD